MANNGPKRTLKAIQKTLEFEEIIEPSTNERVQNELTSKIYEDSDFNIHGSYDVIVIKTNGFKENDYKN